MLITDPMRDCGFQANYSRDDAIRRIQLIKDVSYNFTLALRRGSEYLGSAVIKFFLIDMPESTDPSF